MTSAAQGKGIIIAKKYGPGMAQRIAKAWMKLKADEEKAMKEFEERFGFVTHPRKGDK